jgi:hypothetical protein
VQAALDRPAPSPYTRPVRGDQPAGPDSLCLPAFFRGVIVKGRHTYKQAPPAAGFLRHRKGDPDEDRKLWRGITSAEYRRQTGDSA